MPTPNWALAPVLRFPTPGASLRAFGSSGLRRILVTSAPDDGRAATDSTLELQPDSGLSRWPAGSLSATALELASSVRDSVLIVEAGPARPDRVPLDGTARRGLWELLRDVYLGDLTRGRTARFGLGDWVEILGAQERTGVLDVHEDGQTFQVRFVRGSIRAITCPTSKSGKGCSERELQALASELVVRMVAMSHPVCRFTERLAPAPWAGGSWIAGAASCLDELFRGLLRDRLRCPHLAAQVADHVMDTVHPNLRRMAPGTGGVLTRAVRRPLVFLLDRLSRGFGYVLIDAPPATRPEQVGMLAGLADAALLVTRPADVGSAGVKRAVEVLRAGGATTVGVLVIGSRDEPGA